VYDSRLRLGQVVKSKAGRDKGRYFVIIGIEGDQYLFLADGDLRKMDNAKKKKTKHVAKLNIVLEQVADKLEQGKRVTNVELRKHLKNLGYL